jgi:hypothetical protein
MGARIHFFFKQQEGVPPIALYSHWGADSYKEDLAKALHVSEARWDDPQYGTRIMISYLINNEWTSTLGYGLYVGSDDVDSWDQSVLIDFRNKTVIDEVETFTFEEYSEKYLTSVNA